MKRILIVDDNPGVQDAIRLVFGPEQYELSIYGNGAPLLEGTCGIPDIYILDKQLSGVDGLDICRFLKSGASTRHVPVIMISASPYALRFAAEAGADEVLEKPFSMEQIRALVKKHTGG